MNKIPRDYHIPDTDLCPFAQSNYLLLTKI